MDTDKNLYIVFNGTTRGNGYRYEIRNPNSTATSINDYSIAFIGGEPTDPEVYTMRAQTEDSKLSFDGSLTVVDLGEILSRPTEDISSIEAAGSKEFTLYVDVDSDDIVSEEFNQNIDIVLQKKGQKVSSDKNRRNTLPPTF